MSRCQRAGEGGETLETISDDGGKRGGGLKYRDVTKALNYPVGVSFCAELARRLPLLIDIGQLLMKGQRAACRNGL
jgi:hypothetical protein